MESCLSNFQPNSLVVVYQFFLRKSSSFGAKWHFKFGTRDTSKLFVEQYCLFFSMFVSLVFSMYTHLLCSQGGVELALSYINDQTNLLFFLAQNHCSRYPSKVFLKKYNICVKLSILPINFIVIKASQMPFVFKQII